MDEQQIVDIWTVFKDAVDKKQVDVTAQRYIEVCADFGADDEQFRAALGSCNILDEAITYYLDLDTDYTEEDEYGEDY